MVEKERDEKEVGEIISRNWDLGELRVGVNLPFLTRQVLLPIWRVKTPIRGLLNPIRQVVPLTSHIRSYHPYCTHLCPSSLFLYHHRRTQSYSSLSISPCHDHELTPSTAFTKYTIHPVQLTPSTAYTEYSIHPKIVCLPFMLMITSWPLNVASGSGVPPNKIDRPSQLSMRAQRWSHLITFPRLWVKYQMERVSAPSTPPIDYLQVLLQSCSIMASKCISKLARSQPPSAYPNSLE